MDTASKLMKECQWHFVLQFYKILKSQLRFFTTVPMKDYFTGLWELSITNFIKGSWHTKFSFCITDRKIGRQIDKTCAGGRPDSYLDG
jgi:hypothetical protein